MGEPGTKEVLNLSDLEAAGGIHTGRKHILTLLVENSPGVLARVAGLFARRGFNITTLAVGPTDDPSLSRITLTLDGALHPIDQVTKQLHKLVNVIKIRDLEPEETVARELALFKIAADGETRGQVMQFADIFRGSVVDVSKRSITVEITGADEKIEAFKQAVKPFGLIEMIRTGEIAVSLTSVTVPLPADMDLSATVLAARRPGDRYFCFEQPDRDGFAIAALGAVEVVEARGSGRFEAVAARCREITHGIEGDERGPIWVGGFAFSPDGGMTPEWSSL